MSRTLKTFVCILLLMVLVLPNVSMRTEAAGTTNLTFNVNYHQSTARNMLDTVNQHRANNGRSQLAYDYALEQTAMKRAAELVLEFDHARPDGSGTIVNVAENIAYGYSSISSSFNAFKDSEGHNLNMLDSRWKAAAFSYVTVGNQHFWVQLFTEFPSGSGATGAYDGSKAVTVAVQSSAVKHIGTRCDTSPITVELNKTINPPDVISEYIISTPNHKPANEAFATKENITWTSSDPSIASIEGGKAKGLTLGSVTLTGTLANGSSIEVPLTVIGTSISDAKISLEYTEIEATGSELYPAITSVKLGNQPLTPYVDYIAQYQNNIENGDALVIIEGIGQYSGKASTTFRIKGCEHKYGESTVVKEATCTQEGEKTATCSECGKSKTEAIPKLEHVDSNKNLMCDVCGAFLNLPSSAPSTNESESGSSPSSPDSSGNDSNNGSDDSSKDDKEESDKNEDNSSKKPTPGGDSSSPDTGDLEKKTSVETIVIINIALIATALFVAYLVKLVILERRKAAKRQDAVRR